MGRKAGEPSLEQKRKKSYRYLAKFYRNLGLYERLGKCEDPDNRIPKKLLKDMDFKGKAVLDLGAGTGKLTLPLARKAGLIYALDILRPNLELLKRKARKAGLKNIKTLKAPFSRIPLPSNSVDIAVSLWAFPYHSGNLDRELKEIERVLKPGGSMAFIDMHFIGSEYQRIRKLLAPDFWKLAGARHNRMLRKGFRPENMRIMMDFRDERGVRELFGGFFGPEFAGYLLGTGKTRLGSTMVFYCKRKGGKHD